MKIKDISKSLVAEDLFSKIKPANEDASCGATGAGSIATAAVPMGSMKKRVGESDFVSNEGQRGAVVNGPAAFYVIDPKTNDTMSHPFKLKFQADKQKEGNQHVRYGMVKNYKFIPIDDETGPIRTETNEAVNEQNAFEFMRNLRHNAAVQSVDDLWSNASGYNAKITLKNGQQYSVSIDYIKE